jgi:hypothetical protein
VPKRTRELTPYEIKHEHTTTTPGKLFSIPAANQDLVAENEYYQKEKKHAKRKKKTD